MANTIESQLAGLPPELQAELARVLRQRAMGEAFTTQGLGAISQPTQFSPGPYGQAVRQNPLAGLMHGLTAVMGAKMAGDADTAAGDVNRRAAEATGQAISGISGAGPEIRNTMIAQGLASTNPQVRAFALEQQKRDQATAEAGAKILGDFGDPRAAMDTLRNRQLPSGYQPAPIPGPEFSSVQGPNGPINYGITTNRKGERNIHSLGGQLINVDARQQTQELGAGLDTLKEGLKTRQERAQAAKEVLSSNNTALEALNKGAQTGGLGGLQQATRKVAQGFGVNLPNTASSEELNMALGSNILANARKLAPVTAEDIARLQEILGSLNTDPTALMKALTVYNGIAAKELQDYQRYIGAQTSTLTNPRAADMFRNQEIGYEMPPTLPGGTAQGLRAVQELQRRGGDVSQFAVGGQPIEPGATFDIRGSGVPGATPPLPTVKPISQMTPAEKQAEINALKKKLGMQ